MKIAFIGQPLHGLYPPVRAGSIEIWIYQVARRLARSEQVRVYSKISRKGDSGFETHENVAYRRFPAEVDRYVASALRRLPQLGLVPQPYQEYWSPLYYRRLAAKIGRDLAAWQPDIIHLHNFASFAPVLRAACPGAGIMLHMQCDWLTLLPARRTRHYLDAVDLVAGCSHWVADPVRDRFPGVPARTIYNGVDVTEFQPPREADPPDGPAVMLLFVSRLSPEKGLHTLCEAFHLLAPRHPSLRLKVIGPRGILSKAFLIDMSPDPLVRSLARFYSGDYEADCLNLIDAAYRDRGSFIGEVPHSQLPEHFGAATIFIQPSYWEPFGIGIIEAMACGRPVVGARVGGIPEIIVEGETGLLFAPGDASALAGALERLIADPQARARLGAAGRARVKAEFTYDRVAAELLDCFTRLRQDPISPAGRPSSRSPDPRRGSLSLPSISFHAIHQIARLVHNLKRLSRRIKGFP